MPLDPSIPLSGTQPQPMQSLSNVLDMANSATRLRANQIDLQKATQANNERIAMQGFMSNPDNWQTNGQIDMSKVNAAVPKLAPYTGSDYIGRLTALSSAQTSAAQASQNLSESTRGIVSSTIGILGRSGIDDPKPYMFALDNLKKQFPNDQHVAQMADSYKTILSMTPPGSHISQGAITLSQSLLSPTEQQGALSPTAGLTNTGGQLAETISKPMVGGNAPSISVTGRAQPLTLSPGEQHVLGTDASGNPITIDRSPTGVITGVSGAGGRQPVMPPPGESSSTLPEVIKIRTDANNAAALAPGMHDNAKNIIKLADEIPQGKGGAWWVDLGSRLNYPLGGDEATARQRLGHFMGLQMQQAASAMGADTDAAKATAEAAATGSGDWTPAALKSTAKKYDAYVSGMEYFNKGMEGYLNGQQNTSGQWGARQFRNAWSANFDPVAMEILNAKKNGDTAEYKSLVQANRGNSQLIQKVKALGALSQGHMPQ